MQPALLLHSCLFPVFAGNVPRPAHARKQQQNLDTHLFQTLDQSSPAYFSPQTVGSFGTHQSNRKSPHSSLCVCVHTGYYGTMEVALILLLSSPLFEHHSSRLRPLKNKLCLGGRVSSCILSFCSVKGSASGVQKPTRLSPPSCLVRTLLKRSCMRTCCTLRSFGTHQPNRVHTPFCAAYWVWY